MAEESGRDAVDEQGLAWECFTADQLEIVVLRYGLGPVAAGNQPEARDRGGETLPLLLSGAGRAHGCIRRDPTGEHKARQHRIQLAGAGILERCRG